MNDELRKIKERVHKESLYVKDMLISTKTRFKKLADDEFGGHYGWTLKWLMDFRDGQLTGPGEQVTAIIQDFQKELDTLQSQVNKPEPKPVGRRMMNGKVLPARGARNE